MNNLFARRPRPVVLVVMDGWGIEAAGPGNAISLAKTPHLDSYITNYPTASLLAAEEAVGLPVGAMGTSQVGHLVIGSGQVLPQYLPRINRAVADGTMADNKTLRETLEHVAERGSTLHIVGLVSRGGVHSSFEHLLALLKVAGQEKLTQIRLHVILDGRDTAYNEGLSIMAELEKYSKRQPRVKIATVSGRFYAMDRDNHWERTSKAYEAIAEAKAEKTYSTASEGITTSYQEGIYDEELKPFIIGGGAPVRKGDSILFFNFRADRMRQLTRAFLQPEKTPLGKKMITAVRVVTMTEYEPDFQVPILFPPLSVTGTLAETLEKAGLSQLHVAETEKYAHVTYFFNGGKEEKYEHEARYMVPSPRISSYADQPTMGAYEIRDHVVGAINKDNYDFILVNFANPDMVAHTGDIAATVKALAVVDECVGDIVAAVLRSGGVCLITADHGNAERMINPENNEMDKEHSVAPVPIYIIANELAESTLVPGLNIQNWPQQTPVGTLADIAPTILKIMGLKKPPSMSGQSLI
ncbi:MAG: 2,3-bisphosphoglycerate-independent phosphoglycerate mutase [Candidatus Komeilibacteria bacterium]|nr:2,3-bisphosphoglycerate-independent phosphoglycerate mutase [Candidatus Komeilibacteria bacterium]